MDAELVRAWTDAEQRKIDWLQDYVSAAWEGQPLQAPPKILDLAALEEYKGLTAEVEKTHAAYTKALRAEQGWT